MESVPEAVLSGVPAWLDPLSLKRAALASRAWRRRAEAHAATAAYAVALADDAFAHLRAHLVSTHASCLCGAPALDKPSDEADAWKVARREVTVRLAAEYLRGARARLSAPQGVPDGPPLARALAVLYPLAVGASDWSYNHFALEWCARNEWRAAPELGARGPRRELLALLGPEPVRALAAQAREEGCIAAQALCTLLNAADLMDKADIPHDLINEISTAGRKYLASRAGADAPLVLCTRAAILGTRCGAPANQYLKIGLNSVPGHNQWMAYTGAWHGSDRDMGILMNAFRCWGCSTPPEEVD